MAHFVLLLISIAISSSTDLTLSGAIYDPSGAPLANAHVVAVNTTDQSRWEATTAANGVYRIEKLPEGSYSIEVGKDVFFTFKTEIKLEASTYLDFTLSPIESVKEHVDVVARPEPISTDSVSSQQSIGEAVIQNLPYGGSRNFLNALPLLPDVLEDNSGQIHIDGSRTDQIRYQLDGINITSPAGGLGSKIPIDAIESIDLDLSGYSAELGNGSGGVVRVQSQFVTDKRHWNLTDFVPDLSFKHHDISGFSPRAFLTMPIVQKKSWLMYSASVHYLRTFNESLPSNENRQKQLLADQLVKLQWKAAEAHVLRLSVLNNNESYGYVGLSTLRPPETTTTQLRRGTTVGLSDRHTARGVLFEATAQWTHRRDTDLAKGDAELIISPSGWTGNYFVDRLGHDDRLHFGETAAWENTTGHIVHRFKAGAEFDDVRSDLQLTRRPYEILNSAGQLELLTQFEGPSVAHISNRELGTFVQDRIVFSRSTQVELGFRADHETVTGRVNPAPRMAASYFPFETGHMKISGGLGIFYDNVPLQDLQLAHLQLRITTSYLPDGRASQTAGATAVLFDPALLSPYGVHWNTQWEQEWAPRWVSRINFIQKRGHDQVRLAAAPQSGRNFDLLFNNSGRSSYRALELTLERPIRNDFHLLASYIRSQSLVRPSLSLDFPDPAMDRIGLAPTDWNARHRFISWGFFPFLFHSNAAYTAELRSGFPFSIVNELGHLQGAYNASRYPVFFTTSFSIEKEIPVFGRRLAVRLGATNLFNRFNPRFVDNDIDSPTFMSFSNSAPRGFAGRLRLIQK